LIAKVTRSAQPKSLKNKPEHNVKETVSEDEPMALVPLSILAKRCGFEADVFARLGETLSIPAAALKMLLQLAASAAAFDEEAYLKANPDLVAVPDLAAHFVRSGYFEQRTAGWFDVDESYYNTKYKDAADAIDDGTFASAQDHFEKNGASEMRSPNSRFEQSVEAWKQILP
jgi:hypothetical protein